MAAILPKVANFCGGFSAPGGPSGGLSRVKVADRRRWRSRRPRHQHLAERLSRHASEVPAVPTLRMRRGEPVAAAEVVAARRNQREGASMAILGVSRGIPQEGTVDCDARGSDFNPVSGETGDDLEDRCGVSRAGSGREVGAAAAEAGRGHGQAGGDQPAAGERQGDGTIEAARERRGEVHAHEAAAQEPREVRRREEGHREREELSGADKTGTERARAVGGHKKWRTKRMALSRPGGTRWGGRATAPPPGGRGPGSPRSGLTAHSARRRPRTRPRGPRRGRGRGAGPSEGRVGSAPSEARRGRRRASFSSGREPAPERGEVARCGPSAQRRPACRPRAGRRPAMRPDARRGGRVG